MTQLSTDPVILLAQAKEGSRVALARLLTMVERGGSGSEAVAAMTYQLPIPYTVGLTGAPGAGKSTLTDRLITTAREGWPAAGQQPREAIEQLAVLAIDPSSPFTGGAILGDRVRMQTHATDPTIFIRSMATRGHLGGLSLAVPDAIRTLGAADLPLVLVETVGVGQMEVDVARATDTTVVVMNPGWGDSMQANKAGLLEIADVFVINKADRAGVKEARRDLEQMLDLSHLGDWRPPIVETVAAKGEGTEAFWQTVAEHRAYLIEGDLLAKRRSLRLDDLLAQVVAALVERRVGELRLSPDYADFMEKIAQGSLDPYAAAHQLLGD